MNKVHGFELKECVDYYNQHEKLTVTKFKKWIKDGSAPASRKRGREVDNSAPTKPGDIWDRAKANIKAAHAKGRPLTSDKVWKSVNVMRSAAGLKEVQKQAALAQIRKRNLKEFIDYPQMGWVFAG
eukprot:TRINITY_DN779913_c0_g1_i1.p1 TRINITY_DN779913_c0_g1~~TRINITY_DN779913_c0_g1_i1.p1  ORF type:complete len:126 (-),score=35.57 TRINITY_DN779913_c0_g1_i1:205-582(-)